MRENMASGDLELNVCIDKREGWRVFSLDKVTMNSKKSQDLKLKGNH
jgi:hypothetical protein